MSNWAPLSAFWTVMSTACKLIDNCSAEEKTKCASFKAKNSPCVPTNHLLWQHIHHIWAGFLPKQLARSDNFWLCYHVCLTTHLVGHNILRDGVFSPLFKATSFLRESKRGKLFGENHISWTRLYIKSITFWTSSQVFVTSFGQWLRQCSKQWT